MTTRLLLATQNAKKLAELRRILAEQSLDIEVVGCGDVEPYPEPAETEWTFEGNALIKARAGVQHTGLPTLADDSGLCVDALNQMPGVRSSRWAGPDQRTSPIWNWCCARSTTCRTTGAPPGSWRDGAALPDGREFTTRGEMPGRITHAAKGARGFGYDPIFRADEQPPSPIARPRTNAELTAEEKDAISHRGRALRAMVPVLREVLVETGQEASA